jgi:hypothetical protein
LTVGAVNHASNVGVAVVVVIVVELDFGRAIVGNQV